MRKRRARCGRGVEVTVTRSGRLVGGGVEEEALALDKQAVSKKAARKSAAWRKEGRMNR